VNVMMPLMGLVQGLVAGVVALAVLAVRAALQGGSGLSFGDLWTALAIGIAVSVVPWLFSKVMTWRLRRQVDRSAHFLGGSGVWHGDLGSSDAYVER
jgi:uncharacterized membrane protein YvlD (DUF360 family)